jgi:hypothetical protein
LIPFALNEGYRAGRVRAIFTLPAYLLYVYPSPLAYVELFTPFSAFVSPFHGLHTTSHYCHPSGKRRAAVIPVRDIVLASHISPQFQQQPLNELQLHAQLDLLSIGKRFFLNHYYNHSLFMLVEHWRKVKARRQLENQR